VLLSLLRPAAASNGRAPARSRKGHGELRHAHPHRGPHEHGDLPRDAHSPDEHGKPGHRDLHAPSHSHGQSLAHPHSPGLLDDSIRRSREGVRTVTLALAILAATAAAQAFVFALTGSLACRGGDLLLGVCRCL
jgi:hypothetical protein